MTINDVKRAEIAAYTLESEIRTLVARVMQQAFDREHRLEARQEALGNDLRDARQQCEDFKRGLSESELRVQEAKRREERSEQQRQDLNERLSQSERKCRDFEGQTQDLKRQVQALESLKRDVESKYEDLRQRASELEQQLGVARQQSETLSAENAQVTAEFNTRRTALENAEREREAAQTRAQHLDRELSAQKRENSDLQAKLKEKSDRADEVSRTLERQRSDFQALQDQQNQKEVELRSEFKQCREKLDRISEEYASASTQLAAYHDALKTEREIAHAFCNSQSSRMREIFKALTLKDCDSGITAELGLSAKAYFLKDVLEHCGTKSLACTEEDLKLLRTIAAVYSYELIEPKAGEKFDRKTMNNGGEDPPPGHRVKACHVPGLKMASDKVTVQALVST
jgi:chromosome segregation ATPase